MYVGFFLCCCMLVTLQFIGHHLSVISESRFHSHFSQETVSGIWYGLFAFLLLRFADPLLHLSLTGLELLPVLLCSLTSARFVTAIALSVLTIGNVLLNGLNAGVMAESLSFLCTAAVGSYLSRKLTNAKICFPIVLLISVVFRLSAYFVTVRYGVLSDTALSILLYAAGGFVSFYTWDVLQGYRVGTWQQTGTADDRVDMEERYYRLVEQSPDSIIVHSNGAIVFLNMACTKALRASDKSELLGRNVMDIIHPDMVESIRQQHQTVYETGETMPPTERTYVRLDGETIIVEASASLVSYMGRPSIQVAFRDITVRKDAERRLQETNELLSLLSQLDGLTGIANRRSFDEQLDREWKRCARHSDPLALVLFDIDQFKPYNDTYGHLGGDKCLKDIASTLRTMTLRPGDFLARYGGEEFAILLPETDQLGAMRVAEKVRRLVESMQIPHERSLTAGWVTISLGVASMVCNLQTEPSELIRSADIALYKAKELGRNRVVVF